MEVLGVGYDGFQIAESDIRVLKEIQSHISHMAEYPSE
jgi:hypothetical protein